VSIEKARLILGQIDDLIGQALVELAPEPPRPPVPIATPDAFERALAAAVLGDVITLATSFVYQAPFALRQSITIASEAPPAGRMTLDAPAPRFSAGIKVAGDGITLIGLDVRDSERTHTLIDITGSHATIDRCRAMGDPERGQKRGIAINGAVCTVARCYVEDCFGPYPGDDCQAVYGQDTPGPIVIDDCYLSGGTETVMFGGGDPSSEDRVPADITIAGCTITKRPEWQAKAVGVKNTLELKNAKRVKITDNIIEYSWGGKGQTGYLLVLTPRNQGGSAPYSTVEDVEIARNTLRHGAAAINVMGDDNNKPSQRLSRVTIHDNVFEDLDPVQYAGSKQMILIQRGPRDVRIADNRFAAKNHTSWLYFDGSPQAENLVITGNTIPKTMYGVFGSNSSVGKAWGQYVASGQEYGNSETASG